MLDAMVARQHVRDQIRGPVDPPLSRWMHAARGPLPGTEETTELGSVHVVRQVLPPDHHHGQTPVATAKEAQPAIVAKLALDAGLAGLDLSRMLFLDTETTGLSGGTGTLPFLVGVAWFDDQSLTVEQYLVRRPSEEGAMLSLFARRLREATCLVTYNGKSYDLPLLRSRFVMNRIQQPPEPPHLDLLHSARRVYRRRLGEVRLVNMEEHILGFRRERDIDGAEIPDLYWSALRADDPSALAPVIEHNANDIIALAALLGNLHGRYLELHLEDDPTDHLSLALVAARANDPERARSFARAAAEGGGDDELTVDALTLSAKLARSASNLLEAEQALLRALEVSGTSPMRTAPLHLTLAKLYEHQLKDPARALVHARATAASEGPEKQAKRVARLERRLTR